MINGILLSLLGLLNFLKYTFLNHKKHCATEIIYGFHVNFILHKMSLKLMELIVIDAFILLIGLFSYSHLRSIKKLINRMTMQ